MPTTQCRVPRGWVLSTGYREIRRQNRRQLMHRWVIAQIGYDQYGTPWLDDPEQVVMHECDNRGCIRYDHLRLGTRAENQADMAAKGRGRNDQPADATHCRSGLHEWTDENTYTSPAGMRQCNACRRTRLERERG